MDKCKNPLYFNCIYYRELTMDNQSGGVKRVDPKNPPDHEDHEDREDSEDSEDLKITIKNSVFNRVYNMVNRDNSSMSAFNGNSLKGVMINLTVNETDTGYKNLNTSGKFTVPVTNFILKFVITTDIPNRDLKYYKKVRKLSESQESFFNEAKLQQDIWKRSIIGGRPAICPSVAELIMFDMKQSELLMDFFTDSKANNNENSTTGDNNNVFEFLREKSQISYQDRGIGVLVMPTITRSFTLREFLNLRDDRDDNGKIFIRKYETDIISNALAQVVRLFIEIGVIHFDLHPGNVLIYWTPDEQLKTLLIDFGKASNIISNVNDYLNEDDKPTIQLEKIKFYNNFLNNASLPNTSNDKFNYMQSVLDYIAKLERSKTSRDGVKYQMMWYSIYRNNMEILATAFDILCEMALVDAGRTGINPETITEYEKDGSLINLDTHLDEFIVKTPADMQFQATERNVGDKRPRESGGRKNKIHKTNKRKKGKSNRNRRNKNKNTRKKRKN